MQEQGKRKDKPMLTLIPEQERQIDYRFEFSVVGEGARHFVESAVNSEMAEAFRPTAKEEEKWGHTHSQQSLPADKAAEANGLDHSSAGHPGNPGEAQAPAQSSSFTGGKSKGVDKAKFVLYCPVNTEKGDRLARVRFTVLEHFSDSLPLTRDRNAAINTAVIFLFWHVKPDDQRDEKTGRTPTEDRMKDWMSRIAEINFLDAKFRPCCAILGFETEEGQQASVDEWAKKQQAFVWTNHKPDDAEDTIMESVQELCEKMVERQASEELRPSSAQAESKTEGTAAGKSSRTCAVL